MHSPTGYYALITTTRYQAAAEGEVEDWAITEVFPVVSFQSGESMIVNRAGEVRQAKEYTQEIRAELPGGDGARFTVDLEVTPHHTGEPA